MEVYQFAGFEKVHYNFQDKDGRTIDTSGYRLYFVANVEAENGQGLRTENLFASDAKLANLDLPAMLKQYVNVRYNRCIKFQSMELCKTA
ncbi:hypothetical protein [Eubacterium aggregans]|uniref:hypothetical protein n=1 Tax=Eubacterium aggregans TaxID=81409 RepID=UPI003F3B4189